MESEVARKEGEGREKAKGREKKYEVDEALALLVESRDEDVPVMHFEHLTVPSTSVAARDMRFREELRV